MPCMPKTFAKGKKKLCMLCLAALRDRFGHTNMTAFTDPDFVQLAESMG